MHGKERSKGFTLIELITVIILIGILSVYAQSKLSTGSFEERYLFDDVLNAMRYTQKLAIGSGCKVRFEISSTGFELNSDLNCAVSGTPSFTLVVSRPFDAGNAYQRTSIPSTITAITTKNIIFYPQGWACSDTGNSTTVEDIVIAGAQTRTLRVVCGSGFIYVL